MDKRDSPEFQKYSPLAVQGSQGSIPYTILLDEKGTKVADWVGSVPYEKLVADTKPALDKLP